VPITGYRAKRIVQGGINIHSGEVVVLITQEGVQETHQYVLSMIRSHWRGWNIVRFEDRASSHTAEASLELVFSLGIELRFLPRATPELDFCG
jgi:hypothetical protein